jgi:hypothetical protein
MHDLLRKIKLAQKQVESSSTRLIKIAGRWGRHPLQCDGAQDDILAIFKLSTKAFPAASQGKYIDLDYIDIDAYRDFLNQDEEFIEDVIDSIGNSWVLPFFYMQMSAEVPQKFHKKFKDFLEEGLRYFTEESTNPAENSIMISQVQLLLTLWDPLMQDIISPKSLGITKDDYTSYFNPKLITLDSEAQKLL